MPFAQQIYYALAKRSQEGGSPPPALVLIHGAGGSHLHWPAALRRMPERDVYAIDLPGHGKSQGVGCQSIAAYAQVVEEWMKDCWLDRVVLCGHSMGGAISQQLALHAPGCVAGLILVATGARLRVAAPVLEGTRSEDTFAATVDLIMTTVFSAAAPKRLRALAARQMKETRPPVVFGDFLACNSFDLMAEVGKIGAPSLVLCGSEDRLTPEKYSRFLAEKIKGAVLVVVPGAGHMVMLEQPRPVAAALRAFLDEHCSLPAE